MSSSREFTSFLDKLDLRQIEAVLKSISGGNLTSNLVNNLHVVQSFLSHAAKNPETHGVFTYQMKQSVI